MEPSLSPDGKTLAFYWFKPDSSGIYTRPLAGGQVRLLAGNASSPYWSPDGKQIAFVRGNARYGDHVIVKDLASGVERDLREICGLTAWTPDGSYLVAGEYTHDIPDSPPGCRPALFSARSGINSCPTGPRLPPKPSGIPAFGGSTSRRCLRKSKRLRNRPAPTERPVAHPMVARGSSSPCEPESQPFG